MLSDLFRVAFFSVCEVHLNDRLDSKTRALNPSILKDCGLHVFAVFLLETACSSRLTFRWRKCLPKWLEGVFSGQLRADVPG
jgi:hypothetical protein